MSEDISIIVSYCYSHYVFSFAFNINVQLISVSVNSNISTGDTQPFTLNYSADKLLDVDVGVLFKNSSLSQYDFFLHLERSISFLYSSWQGLYDSILLDFYQDTSDDIPRQNRSS